MPTYRPNTTTVCIETRQGDEAAEVIALCQELASLRDEPLNAAVKRFPREVLPSKIAELRRQVKANPAGEAA